MKRGLLFLVWASALAMGCSGAASAPDVSSDDQGVTSDPLAMPKPVLTFLSTNQWGQHHLEWHTVRQWDLLGKRDQAYAKRQGWARADVQEGEKGNGLEFLAMHRVMIRTLSEKFPSSKALFAGWSEPPTDPDDRADPVPAATKPQEFDPAKLPAIDKLQNHLDDFESDDDIGLYIETSLRPTPRDPSARTTDASAGLHNYIHNRFSDAKSKIDIGDPSVNLQNKRFWRLHGWIESRWTEFRSMKGLTDDDPAYQAAIKKAEDMLTPKEGGPTLPEPEPPPDSLRKFFEQQDP